MEIEKLRVDPFDDGVGPVGASLTKANNVHSGPKEPRNGGNFEDVPGTPATYQ